MSNKRTRQHKAGGATPAYRVIEAHQLVIRDTAGNVRAQLGCAADGHAHLRLMGPDEKPRLAAGVCAGVPGVWLLDAQGRPRLELSLAEDGERVGLHLMDQAGVTRLVLSHGDLGGTQLQLFDLVVGRDGDNGAAPPEAAGPCPDAGAKAGGQRGTDPGETAPSPN
jgi:hypothetical protein